MDTYDEHKIDKQVSGDLCPICGEHITLTGEHTINGRLIGSCSDAFTREQWESDE